MERGATMTEKAAIEAETPAGTAWLSFIQAGAIAGLLVTIFAISHATLITGAIAPKATSTVIGMALIGTTVLCFTSALIGQIRGAISMSQDVPAAAIGAILATVVASRANSENTVSLAEIVALNITATFLFGLTLLLFGTLRLSAVMRYAPRPVLAGFLAGTGYFVLVGAIGICLGTAVTLDTLHNALEQPALNKLFVALTVSAALALSSRVLPPPAVVGGVMVVAIGLFHTVCGGLGIAPGQLLSDGWFVSVPEDGLPWPPVSLGALSAVEPTLLTEQVVPLAIFVVLAVSAVLMTSGAIEVATRTDLNLDGEVRGIGVGNLLSASLGGMAGYPGVASTMAARRVAPGHPLVSVVAGALALGVFMWGNVLLAVLPLPIFAGFLFWVGWDFLKEFLWNERNRTSAGGWMLTIVIVGVIAIFGLFEGAIFGLVAGSLLFVVDYSRQPPVRGTLDGDVYHGSKEYSPAELRVLQDHGDEIAVLKLQGYVFFGTAYMVRDQVKALLARRSLRVLILDFEAVSAVDGTAIASLQRIGEDLADAGAKVCLTGINARVKGVFERTGVLAAPDANFAFAEDLDAGLSGYLDKIVRRELDTADISQTGAAPLLTAVLEDASLANQIAPYLDRIAAGPDETIIMEGSASTDIYFVEAGRLEVQIGAGDTQRRLRELGPGAVIGEISFYAGGVRTSSVRAREDAVLWRFSPETTARILQENPQLASRFHAALAGTLARRVIANTRLLQMLRD